jgi:asparagine synthase (glutamine-hydrolysing)
MCGISGFLDRRAAMPDWDLARVAGAMSQALFHRGPDDGGVWVEAEGGIALSQRRLSIVDLSPAGHQPMVSASGRFVIVFNGEVFNHEDLGRELQRDGIRFRGHSDTEVILEACEAWGVETTVERLIGMFAIGLWDRRERVLWLIRDRMGIKPLYWCEMGGHLLFGSELKALKAHPSFVGDVDRNALASYMRYGYVPGPLSIYEGVQKLQPGHILKVSGRREVQVRAYWNTREVALRAKKKGFSGTENDAVEALHSLLLDSVRRRMIADVPLGAFLSGGIDSSLVVGLMQAQSTQPVRTFSIGFREESHNEVKQATAVARHLGTEHTELYVEARHALEVIPRLPEWYDEPFADSSQVATYLVSEMTRRHVTVALSGDGGDELFGGYNRHVWGQTVWPRLQQIPVGLRRGVAGFLEMVPVGVWDGLLQMAPGRLKAVQGGTKMQKLAAVIGLERESAAYRKLVSQWDAEGLVIGGEDRSQWVEEAGFDDFVEQMQCWDLETYLPDDILTKVDRASMAVALEARVPLLDHRVVEFAWRLPSEMKVREGRGKWILREVLDRYVPRELVDRPKMGFGVPLGVWLRGELRDWAESLLDEGRMRRDGYLAVGPVRRAWEEHQSGRRPREHALWTVLMFQAWLEREKAGGGGVDVARMVEADVSTGHHKRLVG